MNYMVAGKLLAHSGQEISLHLVKSHPNLALHLTSHHITRFFIIGDVICLLMQVIGGSLLTVQNDACMSCTRALVVFDWT